MSHITHIIHYIYFSKIKYKFSQCIRQFWTDSLEFSAKYIILLGFLLLLIINI